MVSCLIVFIIMASLFLKSGVGSLKLLCMKKFIDARAYISVFYFLDYERVEEACQQR